MVGCGKRRVGGVVIALTAVLAAACAPTPDPPLNFEPQVRPGAWAELDLRRPDGSEASVADPDVLRVGDRWYLYGTSGISEGMEAWSTDDLADWRYEGVVWTPEPGAWNDGAGVWAPHVIRDDDGSFLAYYTAYERIGVARAAAPTGPFVDLIDHPLVGGGFGGVGDGNIVRTGIEWLDVALNADDFAIDAFALDASDGSRYLYLSTRPAPGLQAISVVRLLDDDIVEPGPPTEVLGVNLISWESVVREGPWVVERNGRFHLTYSGSPFYVTCYAVGQAVADSPLGPFTRSQTGPFLHDDPAIGISGPGHHSLTTGPSGEDLIFFHTRRPDGVRQTRWARAAYDSDGNLSVLDAPGQTTAGRSSCWPFPL